MDPTIAINIVVQQHYKNRHTDQKMHFTYCNNNMRNEILPRHTNGKMVIKWICGINGSLKSINCINNNNNCKTINVLHEQLNSTVMVCITVLIFLLLLSSLYYASYTICMDENQLDKNGNRSIYLHDAFLCAFSHFSFREKMEKY